jgi:hypothetical protein
MRYPLILLFVLASYLSFSQITVDVRSLGAVGDSATLNTTFIQQAIDNVSNAGGGTVLIDSGIYSSSTIILKSNVTLRITPGTVLKGLADASYPYIPYNTPSWPTYQYTQQSMIFAEQASNIRITGGGTIDGNGFQFAFVSIAKNFRPMGLRLHDINGLIIDSINLRQAPQWMVHIMGCSNVHINAVDVYNQCWGVNDGIDIDCCTNVLAENSHFDTNDDCIPVKTQANDSVCRDVTIRNCTMATFERPVKVGCESFGPLINIRFQNITVNASSYALSETPLNAIYIGIADGGSADSIFIDSIQVNTLFTTPVFIRLCERDFQYDTTVPHQLPKYLRNVWISNVTCPGTIIPSSVSGIQGYDPENIYLGKISLTVPGRGPAVTGNLPGLDSLRPECNIWGDSLPAYGLFSWHVNGLFLDSFCVTTDTTDVRPEYYFIDTTNIPSFVMSNGCTANYNDIKDVEQQRFAVYPNPATDMVNVRNLPAEAEALIVYSMTGERITMFPTLGRGHLAIPVGNLSAGVYILNALGNGYSANMRMVVVH